MSKVDLISVVLNADTQGSSLFLVFNPTRQAKCCQKRQLIYLSRDDILFPSRTLLRHFIKIVIRSDTISAFTRKKMIESVHVCIRERESGRLCKCERKRERERESMPVRESD